MHCIARFICVCILACLNLIVMPICGCFGATPFVLDDYSFTEIELRGTAEDDPLQNVMVVATLSPESRSTTFITPQLGDSLVLAPTDENGRTTIVFSYHPIVYDFPDVIWDLSVQVDDETVSIQLENADGASASETGITARIVQTRAQPPAAPELKPLLGSAPPRVEISGYISMISVCNDSTNTFAWRVHTPDIFPFLESATIGEVPDGFRMFDYGLNDCNLGLSRESAGPDGQFTIFVQYAGSDDLLSTTYCVDEQGTIVACSE